MAVEETSIIAAASKTAKWVRDHGEITSVVIGKEIIGQIQIAKVKNFTRLKEVLLRNHDSLVEQANAEVASGLVRRGGGVKNLTLRQIARGDGFDMAVIHVMMDPCDAMGANIMNQVCEFLKVPIEEMSEEKVTMCILSNLVDSKITRTQVTIRDIEADLGNRIQEASLFACLDPYRAATNNKGVLNGIDPILIATGNDWRAVEAGIHAYAARDGQYRSITVWKMQGKDLIGTFEAPLVVGLVGGVTQLHPMAKICIKMLGLDSAEELSQVCASVGLVQNLGALKALTTVGIIEGHMKLHIRNLTLGAGAEEKEIPIVQKRLEQILAIRKRISLSNAIEVLRELRSTASKQSEAKL
jgi:hydroxymethylglutaryl-CoA reductase